MPLLVCRYAKICMEYVQASLEMCTCRKREVEREVTGFPHVHADISRHEPTGVHISAGTYSFLVGTTETWTAAPLEKTFHVLLSLVSPGWTSFSVPRTHVTTSSLPLSRCLHEKEVLCPCLSKQRSPLQHLQRVLLSRLQRPYVKIDLSVWVVVLGVLYIQPSMTGLFGISPYQQFASRAQSGEDTLRLSLPLPKSVFFFFPLLAVLSSSFHCSREPFQVF